MKPCLYDIPEADTPPSPLPTFAHASCSNETSLAIEPAPHTFSSSSTETSHTSDALPPTDTSHFRVLAFQFILQTNTSHLCNEQTVEGLYLSLFRLNDDTFTCKVFDFHPSFILSSTMDRRLSISDLNHENESVHIAVRALGDMPNPRVEGDLYFHSRCS